MMKNDIFAEMEEDALADPTIPSDQKLKGLAAAVRKQLDMEAAVDKMSSDLKALKKDLDRVQMSGVPSIMAELGLTNITLNTGEVVEVKPFVGAHITPDRKDEAHTWLRDQGHGDLIKTETTVNTGRDQKAAAAARQALEALGLLPTTKEAVHNGTLRVFVREQVEAGASIPLELFGAYIGQKSTIRKGK
jgi:hypothetical protein